MCEKKKADLIKCPECPVKLPVGARRAQSEHMESEHPEVFARRLQERGLPHMERMLQ